MLLLALALISCASAFIERSPEEAMQRSMFSLDQQAELVDKLQRRLAVDESFYKHCVFWINSVRAREGLPALKRWNDKESCSDEMSANDQAKNIAHHGFSTNTPAGCKDGMGAQNTCPNWDNTLQAISGCTVAMWDEKVDVIDNGDKLGCQSGKVCGHYYALRGYNSFSSKVYNNYDKVACGFSVNSDGKLWINQNFGFGDDFACAGGVEQMPSKTVEEDCSTTAEGNDYGDCTVDYFFYGCETRTCDPDYDGPCENLLASSTGEAVPKAESEGLRVFDICGSVKAPCDPSQTFFTMGQAFKTVGTCRETCGTCGCTAKPRERPIGKDEAPENECDTGKADCSENAVCEDTKEGFKCTCKNRFEGDGKTCTKKKKTKKAKSCTKQFNKIKKGLSDDEKVAACNELKQGDMDCKGNKGKKRVTCKAAKDGVDCESFGMEKCTEMVECEPKLNRKLVFKKCASASG